MLNLGATALWVVLSDRMACVNKLGGMPTYLPEIAVIVTCHDYGEYLAECLGSVLSQMHPASEVLVALDDCTDNSLEVAARFAAQGVRTLTIRAGDVYLARRAGLKATRSPLVCFLDADDLLTPEYLKSLVPFFRNSEIGIASGEAHEIGLSQNVWKPSYGDILQENCCVSPSLVRRAALEECQAFEQFEPLTDIRQDWYVWKRVLTSGWKLGISEVPYWYRRHARNATLFVDADWTQPWIRNAGKPSRRKVRTVFVTPSLIAGGVVRQLCALTDYGHGIEWLGVIIADGGEIEESAVREISRRMPVFAGRSATTQRIPRLTPIASTPKKLRELLEDAELVYAWGHTTRPLLEAVAGQAPVLFALHATGAWATESIRNCGDLASAFVGVAERCRTLVPDSRQSVMKVIHNGADLLRLQRQTSRDEIRARWGIDNKTLAVGYVGRWSEEKNPMALALAVQALGEESTAVYCLPNGANSEKIPEEERKQALELTGGRVVWTSSDQMGDVYGALDCVLLPSHEEGCPLVALEAFACGCPLVSTLVGALEEITRCHGSLFVETPADANGPQLAASIREAISPGHRSAVEYARDVALNFLNAQHMARNWERLFLQTVEQSENVTPASQRNGFSRSTSRATDSRLINSVLELEEVDLLNQSRLQRWKGSLQTPHFSIRKHNPRCGDEVAIHLEIQGGRVRDVRFEGRGCFISQSTASLLCERIVGEPIEELVKLTPAQLLGFECGALSPGRQHCALLAVEGLTDLLRRTRSLSGSL